MSVQLEQIIDAFADLRILVIGEAMLDTYLRGGTRRLCPEAPVPVVDIADRRDVPGGAANTALNVRTLGAEAVFLSVIGDDCEGQIVRELLRDQGIRTEHLLTSPERRTLAKSRVVADGQLVVRYDMGTTAPLDPTTERHLINHLQTTAARCDAVIVSDYCYGILTPRVIAALSDLNTRHGKLLLVDSKRLPAFRECGVTAVKPNYRETMQLLDLQPELTADERSKQLVDIGDQVLAATGSRIAAVTLDTEGALIFEQGCPAFRTYSQPRGQAQVAGAGDTFMAALALSLAAGATTPVAAEIASAAAAVVVAKDGTACCTSEDLLDQALVPGKVARDLSRLRSKVAALRQQGRRVVMTGGCFDILHRGHITYLNRAKTLGDVLVVAVNSDASIRRLKGPERPINCQDDRVQVLAALSCIDHLVVFDDDTPMRVIEAVAPDVFVKGGDYSRDSLPEADLVEQLGGRIEILPLVEDRSTTAVIQSIKAADAAPLATTITTLKEASQDVLAAST
jgi:D-beta-D-heptose 7-phosphate kinase / D-beta-D-heptose 1-phosphate adenosyltransferase